MPLEEKAVITYSIIVVMILTIYAILVFIQKVVFKQSSSILYKNIIKTQQLFSFLLGISILLLPIVIAVGLLVNLWSNY